MGLILTAWAVSMLMNIEAWLLNKNKSSLIVGVVFAVIENYILYHTGTNGLFIVLPLSIVSFFLSLKVTAVVTNVTGRGNAAQFD